METIYLNVNARQVTACREDAGQKACVGQETACYTVLPRRKAPRRAGQVLDFAACRRALEEAEPAPAVPPAGEETPAPRHRWDLALAADLVASAGMLGAVLAVAVRFFLG